eukprot:GFUD01001505.1.p2 GENE.GFUD01001505.1~~GFUD01001505.1.p2  ORF type:complete len:112 (-),score=9.74 GFUD01001505.1:308-643(-)
MTSQTEKCASKFVFMMLIAWPENIVRRMFAGLVVGQTQTVRSDKFAARDQRNPPESVKRAVTLAMIAQSDRNAKMEHVRTLAPGSPSAVQMPSVWPLTIFLLVDVLRASRS